MQLPGVEVIVTTLARKYLSHVNTKETLMHRWGKSIYKPYTDEALNYRTSMVP